MEMENSHIRMGSTTYIYKTIEGKACYVWEDDPENVEFIFQEKIDKAGNCDYIGIVSREKFTLNNLPDIAKLPPMPAKPNTIYVGCTRFVLKGKEADEEIYLPRGLPVEIIPEHAWIPHADRVNARYVFQNAGRLRVRVDTLPPTCDYVQRIERFYEAYNLGTPEETLEFLTKRAGLEEESLAALITLHGPEPAEYLHYKETLCALFATHSPTRMMHVLEILDANKGNEEALINRLRKKYASRARKAAAAAAEAAGEEEAATDEEDDIIRVEGRTNSVFWAAGAKRDPSQDTSL